MQMMYNGENEDNTDTDGLNEVYRQLKTNREDNLHVSNTRFNHDSVKNGHGDKLDTSSTACALTKTLAERNTRINSANFNPHSVSNERDRFSNKKKTRTSIDSTKLIGERKLEEQHDNTSVECERGKTLDQTGLETVSYSPTGININESNAAENQQPNAEQPVVFCEPRKDSIVPFAIEKVKTLNESEGNMVFPERTQITSDDNDDADPLEGLNIPRERYYSVGSASVYSVKEISDDLYREYMAEVKSSIRSYGFFEAFPTPSLVREAQNIYRNLEIPTPVDEEGKVLPHPSKIKVRDSIPDDAVTVKKKLFQVGNI